MRLSKIFLVLLAVLTMFSCRKDQTSDPSTTPIIGPFEVVNSYTVDVQGFVTTPGGIPIENALIKVAGQEVFTTEAGTFYIEKLIAPESGLFLLAESEGHFKGGTSIYSHSNNLYTANIVLIPFDQLISFDAGDGVDFVSDTGAKLKIEAGSIIDNNGNIYNGTVDAYMYWINPTAEDMIALSPGPLVGVQENEMQSLRSFGMIGVEMYGSAGQELNIAEGMDADLSFPVPSEIQSEAPSEIDLWHFDENLGLWNLEGTATLVDGEYQASVPHFSWWNCDVPTEIAFVCFNLVNEAGRPIGNLELVVSNANFGVASAWVDASGIYCDIVPAGQELTVSLYTFCGDVVYSETIMALEENEVITLEIPLGSNANDEVNVSGVVSCGVGNVVTNGFVVLTLGTTSYLDYLDDQGNYSVDIITCAENSYDATITAFDLDGLTNGAEEITIADQDIMGFNIDGCSESLGTETLLITDGTTPYVMAICEANITTAEITIVAKDDFESNAWVIIGVDGFDVGTHSANLFSSIGVNNAQSEQGLASVTITTYSDVPGEKIAGTYSFQNVTGSFIATVQ